ncbi:MAG: hypothetical protein WC683_04490 [bacterium]
MADLRSRTERQRRGLKSRIERTLDRKVRGSVRELVINRFQKGETIDAIRIDLLIRHKTAPSNGTIHNWVREAIAKAKAEEEAKAQAETQEAAA